MNNSGQDADERPRARLAGKPWIPMRADLWDDPHVIRLSDLMGQGRATVIGCLHRLWSLANLHTTDGRLRGITLATLDRLCEVQGFAEAAKSVGWLKEHDGSISVPNFARWNGESAKKRFKRNARQRRWRHRKQSQTKPDDVDAHVHAGASTRETRSSRDGDGEEDAETDRRGGEKETRRRAETESPAEVPAGFLSGLIRSDSERPRMDVTQRRKIQGTGQLRLASDPALTRLRDELLALKRQRDENDANTVNKLLILWIHCGLPAGDLGKIIALAERYGRKRFAYAVGLAKKRIGERLWNAY